jgi:hypothetical protein
VHLPGRPPLAVGGPKTSGPGAGWRRTLRPPLLLVRATKTAARLPRLPVYKLSEPLSGHVLHSSFLSLCRPHVSQTPVMLDGSTRHFQGGVKILASTRLFCASLLCFFFFFSSLCLTLFLALSLSLSLSLLFSFFFFFNSVMSRRDFEF